MEHFLSELPVAAMTAAAVVVVIVFQLVALVRTRYADVRTVLAELEGLRQSEQSVDRVLRSELASTRRQAEVAARDTRRETARSMKDFTDSVLQRMGELAALQSTQLDHFSEQLGRLTTMNEQRIEAVRRTVEQQLAELRANNATKLEEMRRTVDEKLHGTLDRRLGESFRQVSDRLEQVHQGLGEMQTLASGVGDLKRMLGNVKLRGTWGEIRLESLLEQILAPEQYAKNVATRGGGERVEFALKLPGRDPCADVPVWLPIDAKFPYEDYERLIDAQERGDADAAVAAAKQLDARIRASARDIRDKYLAPPATTDFAVMFLPTEGLYAEVVRRPDLVEALQRDARVVVAGPATLAALLNSLQMGFRTLAIEQRSGEVWKLLSSVKSEFGRFGGLLDKAQRKLGEASTVLDQAAGKSRTIERRLRNVEGLPGAGGDGSTRDAAMTDDPQREERALRAAPPLGSDST